MAETQPPRPYDASRRRAQARATQREIVRAAHELFVTRGYRATTMAAVAAAAQVSTPTVYAGFPTKADLLRRAIETAFAGDDAPVTVAERPTARWVHDSNDPAELLRRYATMCGELAQRSGPIYAVLIVAADGDDTLSELLDTFEAQRLVAAAQIADGVAERGGLAPGLDAEAARDRVWIANGPELYLLTVKRGWSLDRYVALVGDLLNQLVDAAVRAVPEG